MGAMTANITLPIEQGNQNDIPMISGAHVFEGSAVGLASGYARQLIYNNIFAGHAIQEATNVGKLSGATFVKVRTGRYRLQVTLTGVVQANVGALVYMTYDGTYTLSDTSAVKVGRIMRIVAANTCVVEFTALAL